MQTSNMGGLNSEGDGGRGEEWQRARKDDNQGRYSERREERKTNKAGYTATPVACGWAGAVLEIVTRTLGQEQ